MADDEPLAPVEMLAVGDEEPLAPVEGVADGGAAPVGEGVAGSDMVAASPLAFVTDGVALSVTSVAEAVDDVVGTEVEDGLRPGGNDDVGEMVPVDVKDGMPDVEAETPTVSELVAVMVPVGVDEALTDGAAVSDGDEPSDTDELAVCVDVTESDGRTVSEADVDAETPGASEFVGVSVAVTGADCVRDADADQVLLAVIEDDGVAPVDREDVADDEAVAVAVPEPVPDRVPVPDTVGVNDAVPVRVGVPEGVEPGESVVVAVPDADDEKDVDGVWLGVNGWQASSTTAPAPPKPVTEL